MRASHAVAAFTAAATAWGAVLRHCDPVHAVEVHDGRAVLRTPAATVHAARVVLAGRSPLALAPALRCPGPVITAPTPGSFAAPALGRTLAASALPG